MQKIPPGKMKLPWDFPSKTGSIRNQPLVTKSAAKLSGIPTDIFLWENPPKFNDYCAHFHVQNSIIFDVDFDDLI